MYLKHNEGKSVIADRFIRSLKNRIYRHLIFWAFIGQRMSKNVYIDVLGEIVHKYNGFHH